MMEQGKSAFRIEAERRVAEHEKRRPHKRLYKSSFYWRFDEHRAQLIDKLTYGLAISAWQGYLAETLPKIQTASAIRTEERWQECVRTCSDSLLGKPRHSPVFFYEEQPTKTTYPRDPEVWTRAMPEKARSW